MSKQDAFITTVPIQRFSSKGYGVGFFQKKPESPVSKVEVPFAVSGDLLEIKVGKKRKGSYSGRIEKILQPSVDRVAAPCLHAPTCGGCSWQQLAYGKQLQEKQQLVEMLFAGMVSQETKMETILAADALWQYRNKMEYTFSQNAAGERFLGLMMSATKGKVQNLQECHLTSPWFISVLQEVRKWWEQSHLGAFHLSKNTGSLRTLILREGKRTGHKMVMLTVSGNPDYALKKSQLHAFVAAVKLALASTDTPSLSIFLRIQQAVKGHPTQFYEMLLDGPDHLLECLDIRAGAYQRSYQFKVSPTAFFQPNPGQAEKLYAKALEIAGMERKKSVWDLYAGTSTLGLIFAPFADEVLSIEINPHAVFDAETNKETNQIENVQIHKGDVGQVLKQLRENNPQMTAPDLVLLDPPRTGLTEEAIHLILDSQPQDILYISCHPTTQARDCMKFFQSGYKIITVQPVDQFPHTVHVENIVLLRKS